MRMIRLMAALLGAALAAPVAADQTESLEQRIRDRLKTVNPAMELQELAPTPLPGVLEAVVSGQVYYVSEDGRYLLQGELFDLAQRRSLTEPRRQELRLAELAKVPLHQMVVYPAQGERKQTISVFTDIDCGYCRRLHEHMPEMNARGIEVRYLFFPRAGVGSDSHRKAVNVWCADQPLEAMTAAKRGQPVPDKQCKNPVEAHMAVAEQVGVNATPTIVTDHGGFFPGYLPPDQLLQRLEAEDGREGRPAKR